MHMNGPGGLSTTDLIKVGHGAMNGGGTGMTASQFNQDNFENFPLDANELGDIDRMSQQRYSEF